MQPPPPAVPPGVVGPPPSGTSPSMLWSGSPYRRQAAAGSVVSPVSGPLQPVTDPFAFSRQALHNTSLGSLSKSSPPILPSPAPLGFPQRPGLPVPHTTAGAGSQGPRGPLPEPLPEPTAEATSFSSMLTPSAPPGPEMNRGAEAYSSSEREVQTQYIPGAGPDGSRGGLPHGNLPGPDRPLSEPSPHDSAAAPAATPFPHQQMPGPWGLVQGLPAGQHHWPGPEGPALSAVPQTSSMAHLLARSSPHQGPGHEQHNPPGSLLGPLAGDGRDGNHSASHLDPENTFRQNVGVEVVPQAVNKEQLPDAAPMNPPAQGNGLESHAHYPLGAGAGAGRALPEADSGALSMFFQGGETENEENLSSEKSGSAGQCDVGGFPPGPGLGRSVYVGTGSVYQAFLSASNSEATPQGGDTQPSFHRSSGTQHDKAATENAAVAVWDDPAGAGTRDAGGSHYENTDNSEFTQNQEVLPREPPSLDPSSPADQFRYGPLPGPALPGRSVMGHAGGGGPQLAALDMPLHPMRPDSVSSSCSSKSHRTRPSAARPQDLGTFIQQEVGRPEDEASGNFFKQIDSSPVGGDADETAVGQKYHGSLPQPSTPSPPKPIGIFQTSANSSFEPVRSHVAGVKPVEVDRANVVGEVRRTPAQQKQRRPAAVPPDACPGNLEQPPDNMETLLPPPGCPLPLTTAPEAGQGLPHPGGLPAETVLSTPEKRPSARAQGAAKCESPATTLWAQNELPDFGGNVLLAPAAPALHVPVRPQSSEVIQPPDEGVSGQLSRQLGGLPPLQSGAGLGVSENLENPPELGEEEALRSQAGSGFASLLSSPPTESLQSQPVLIAQPDQSYSLAQPVNFSASFSNPSENAQPWRGARAGDKPATRGWATGADHAEPTPLSGVSLVGSPHDLAQSNFPQVSGTPETVSTQPVNLLVQPPPHPAPKSLLPEGQKTHTAESVLPDLVNSPAGGAAVTLGPPTPTTSGPHSHKADRPGRQEETPRALDFSSNRTSEDPVRTCSPSLCDGPPCYQQTIPRHSRQPGPEPRDPDHFYPQVTRDAEDQRGLERAQQEPAPPPPPGPKAALSEPSHPESPPAHRQPPNAAPLPASPDPADLSQRPPRSSSASVVSSGSSPAAVRLDQQWQQPPPPDLASYYYYRSLYDGYPSQYHPPYLPDPGTAPLYYQVGFRRVLLGGVLSVGSEVPRSPAGGGVRAPMLLPSTAPPASVAVPSVAVSYRSTPCIGT